MVVTVHDMTHEKFPQLLDRRGKHARHETPGHPKSGRDHLRFPSHSRRSAGKFPECESRTSVIYHATELGSVQPDDWQPESDRPYFLYVGSRATYKNFDRLLKAFHTIMSAIPMCNCGPLARLSRKCEQHGLPRWDLRITCWTKASSRISRLATLYRLSVGLVYPSLYEGFGLPLLEAMSCDTPVLAADCSCIPEVVKDAALLFDPNSESQLTEGLEALLRDQRQRESLVLKGKNRCQDFSWAKSANQTVGVYRSVLAAQPATNKKYFSAASKITKRRCLESSNRLAKV